MNNTLKNWIIVKSPNPKEIWVKIIARIKNNKTGQIKEYETIEIWNEYTNKPYTYNWEEGNYSCDCNRALMFDGSNIPCSTGKFSVNLVNPKTNEVFYKEFDE